MIAFIPPGHYPISHAIICCCNISRLPETQGDKPAKRKFKSYPIGYFHVDIAEVRTEEGKLYLFVAIDRTSKFASAQLHEKAKRWTATHFLKALIKAVPYKIHTVLTDNGIQFTAEELASVRDVAGVAACADVLDLLDCF